MRGAYGDPRSPWFNVFCGYYQLDAPRPAWKRPFGYDIVSGKPVVQGEDIVRVGKADWNYFSNYMYGVPEDCITPYDTIDLARVKVVTTPLRAKIGDRYWDLVEVDGLNVVSAYESDASHARQLVNNSPYTKLWQAYFGAPASQAGHKQSFSGTVVNARFYMSYTEEAGAYRTVLFGGTVNTGFPAADTQLLLKAEMTAVERVIKQSYAHLGFSTPGATSS